jgi:two-component system, cell cycle response regulator DivK
MKRAARKEKRTVLVVEDYDDSRQVYVELLGEAGYDVVEACDGAEAIAKARETPPDLVVMDLSLPVIDGWEATRQLKLDARTRHIPIVALTGHALERLKHQSGGAEGERWEALLPKPCTPDRLLATVGEVLARTRRSMRKLRIRTRTTRQRASGS